MLSFGSYWAIIDLVGDLDHTNVNIIPLCPAPVLCYFVKSKQKLEVKRFRLGHNGMFGVIFGVTGMVPGSTRTELLAPLIQATFAC